MWHTCRSSYYLLGIICVMGFGVQLLAQDTVFVAKTKWTGNNLEVVYQLKSANPIVNATLNTHNQFTITEGPNWKETKTTIDGQQFFKAEITYLVQPSFYGRLKLPQVEVRHTHGTLISNVQLVNSTNQALPTLPSLPGVSACETQECLGKELFLESKFSKAKYYQGEPIPLQFWLHTKVACTQVNTQLLGAADMSIQVVNADSGSQYYQKNGVVWKKILLASYQLFIDTIGRLALPKLEAAFVIQTIKGKETVIVQSNSGNVELIKLPAKPLYAKNVFAVGEWKGVTKPSISVTNQLGKYTFQVLGTTVFSEETMELPNMEGIVWQPINISIQSNEITIPFTLAAKQIPDSLLGVQLYYFDTKTARYNTFTLPTSKVTIQKNNALQITNTVAANQTFQRWLITLVFITVLIILVVVIRPRPKTDLKPTKPITEIVRVAEKANEKFIRPTVNNSTEFAEQVWQQIKHLPVDRPPHIDVEKWKEWRAMKHAIHTWRFAPPTQDLPDSDWCKTLENLYAEIIGKTR